MHEASDANKAPPKQATRANPALNRKCFDRRGVALLIGETPGVRSVATCRSSYGIHFFGNRLRQSALIQVEVIASHGISEAGFPS